MRKRFLSIVLALAMCLALMPMSVFAQDQTYLLWIGDVQVTSTNKDDVFGDGTVRFDSDNHILYLNGYEHNGSVHKDVHSNYGLEYHSGITWLDTANGLTIQLTGTNTVALSDVESQYESYGIFAVSDLTIQGSGSLKVNSSKTTAPDTASVIDYRNSIGIFVFGADLTVKAARVDSTAAPAAGGSCGIWVINGSTPGGDFTVGENSVVTATADVSEHRASDGISVDNLVVESGAEVTGRGGTAIAFDSDGISAGFITVGNGAVVKGFAGESYNDSYGIYAWDDFTVEKDAVITGIGSDADGSSYGIYAYEDFTAGKGSEINGTAGSAKTESVGLYAKKGITLDETSVTLKGYTRAAEGEITASQKALASANIDGSNPDKLDSVAVDLDSYLYLKTAPGGIVTVTPAGTMNAAKTGGDLLQIGKMTDVIYTAADGYYFPADYASLGVVNGVAVTRTDAQTITVSGTPSADTEISLAPASLKAVEPPKMLDGAGQKVTAGESKVLTFRSDADISAFIRVEVDGVTLSADKYSVKSGSTIVELKKEYVATLSAGIHTLSIVSQNGKASATFKVETNSAAGTSVTSPQTGDDSSPLWFPLVLIGVLGFGVISSYRRKTSVK